MADERQVKAFVLDDSNDISFGTHTDQQIFEYINEKSETRWVPLESAQIFEAIDLTEMAALTTDEQSRIDRILGLSGQIDLSPGSKARAEIADVFPNGGDTITSLAAAAGTSISRGEDAGIGDAKMGIVQLARTF